MSEAGRLPGFHSTKEGFKAGPSAPAYRQVLVSIPLRKVSRQLLVSDLGPLLRVSIPLRKVSRRGEPCRIPFVLKFPFH